MASRKRESDPESHEDADLGNDYWRHPGAAPARLEALRAGSLGDAEFRALADNLPTLCWIANADGYIVWYNRRWHEYCGTTPEEMEGWGWQSVHDPERLPAVLERWTGSIATGEPFEMVFPLRGADGCFRPFLTRVAPMRDASGRVARWFGINTEIGAQVSAERALAASEQRHRTLIESLPQLVWTALPDGRCDYLSRQWVEYTGMPAEEHLDFNWLERALHPQDRERTLEHWKGALAGRHPYDLEYRIRRHDGAYCWFKTRGTPIRASDGSTAYWFGTCTDIQEIVEAREALARGTEELERRVAAEVAERVKAEEALRQAQKMEAVGQLTGGIAHDFNNLLTVVLGNLDTANRALRGGNDARAKRALEHAAKGAERAAALTQRLLAFSRRQPLAPKALEADKLVAGMSDLLHRALGETVRLEIVTSPGLWRIEADPNQLESSVLNLAVNARDAMPNGGTLTIETANARLDEEYPALRSEVAPGQYVAITVTDTGHGMSTEVIARAFEPFFTTKAVGQGTGLGLSMVYGFVKQSGGHVKIYSERQQGTAVKIYLPRVLHEALEDASLPAPGLAMSARQETILVVEDDDDVRRYTLECLRELGYQVLEAHDATSALRLFERQEAPIDLLFTDVVMPGLSGPELAEAMRRKQPRLKMLYTSGYTRNAIGHGGRLDAGVEMIVKPFTYQALAAKIRDVLDAGER